MNIKKLVEFLYSSDNSNDIPFRLSLLSGQYTGWDLNKEQCQKLLSLLNNPENYNKEKFKEFLKEFIYQNNTN